ncbi:IclR family transcriptional regulator [Nesterenkonia aerolata]|uniref:IclR family transcriptional regulator n=1 Tax=Nesterenkonia aerolata TaxID=3074079 RepID=A0ABU2DS42_9MICC|nr:IclR family transcriptional regulator [Nesterenkonia sp. LY-0111]MDR8019321.1 IclR family transcriptional regulator [Nesterenkonia sp. LY-0111]
MATGTNRGRTLERAFGILRCLETSRSPMRLSEVARAAGLHIATAQRILGTLIELGYVQLSDQRYSLGPVVLAQAHAFVLQDPVAKAAQPVLAELSQDTGLTSSVWVRVGAERILTVRIEAPTPLRYQFPVGRRLPLDVGGGKVLLAHMPEEEAEALLADYTGRTLATGNEQTRDDLLEEMAEIRAQGYYLADSERHLGSRSVTTIIRTEEGGVVGALNVVSTDEATGADELRRRVPDLLRAAELIGSRR